MREENKVVNKTDLIGDIDEKRFVYQSNFYQPDSRWPERTRYDDCFRQDAYYYVITYGLWSQDIEIVLVDFRLTFDIEYVKSDNEKDRYGVFLKQPDKLVDYIFSIERSGHYSLTAYENYKSRKIISCRFSDLFRCGNSSNSLIVEKVGQKITLGVNGQVLDTVMDSTIKSAYFTPYVSRDKGSLRREIGLRNFRLYNLGSESVKPPPTLTSS